MMASRPVRDSLTACVSRPGSFLFWCNQNPAYRAWSASRALVHFRLPHQETVRNRGLPHLTKFRIGGFLIASDRSRWLQSVSRNKLGRSGMTAAPLRNARQLAPELRSLFRPTRFIRVPRQAVVVWGRPQFRSRLWPRDGARRSSSESFHRQHRAAPHKLPPSSPRLGGSPSTTPIG